ncbi:MAG: hypothetical protein Q9201_002131 [Fulgogasparrea decipioides]
MNVDNIVIPGGILATWQGPQLPEDGNGGGESESFDITQVARRRARSLSVSLDGQGYGRENNLERLASVLRLSEATQRFLQPGPKDTPGQAPRGQRPQRSTTINLGGLGRTRVTGLNTPANPGLRLDLASSASFPTRPGAAEKLLQTNPARELGDSYVFQSLENYQLPGQQRASITSVPPVFLARNSSNRTTILRRESSRKKMDRSQSNTSQFSTIDVVRRASVAVENVVEKVKETVASALRRSSLQETYEKAKIRQVQLMRSTLAQLGFQYTFYLLMLAFIYFVFVGIPLWNGLVLTIYYLFDMKLVVPAGTAIFLGIGFLYAYLPLLIPFEKQPAERPQSESLRHVENGQANDTALLIPCYKSENLIGATLEAALKIFPAQNIFQFPYVLLIDDDCLLPPNFPIVTDRIRGKTLCIGYTIKSVGPNSSKGTLCQQAQDVEYKISGIQRAFAGKVGSATFPHGAISIWDRKLLIKTFQAHPGFSVSEDWFFGHVARQLGCRIQMCTAVFVETETPTAIFFSGGGARGGFGECVTSSPQKMFAD